MAVALSPIVSLGGRRLSRSWLDALIEVKVECEFQVPGRCSIRFRDPGYILLQKASVKLGSGIEIEGVAESGDLTRLIKAEITSVAVEQTEGGQPELVVTGLDKSHRLGRGSHIESYQSMSYGDIVRKIASIYNLAASVDATGSIFEYVMQAESDLALLGEMAHRAGFDWWVDGETLNFKEPASHSSVHLSLGDDLRSFSVRASGHHPSSVTVDGWDRTRQTHIGTTVTSASTSSLVTSSFAHKAEEAADAFPVASLHAAGVGAHSEKEAKELGQAILGRALAAAVTAQGVTDGNGAIRLGASVVIEDAGPLSGSYPVTKVVHVYREGLGFVTRFRSGERGPTSIVDAMGRGPAGASMVEHATLRVAQVTNINDPDHHGRLKIRYPGVSSTPESGWARLVAIGAGPNRGNVFIPEVGDEVLVGFEGGDLREPVVIGGLYGAKSTLPGHPVADGSVEVRGITSRLGHVLQFADGTTSENKAILLRLAGEQHMIRLGDDALKIQVPAGTPLSIVAGSASITMTKNGGITIEGATIDLKATGGITVNGATVEVAAQAELKLEGQGQVGIKGAMLQVKGDGPVTIKGTPVMIN